MFNIIHGIIKLVIYMRIIDNVIDSAIDAFRFKDTIFYKENSDLQDRYDALKRLNDEYPNNNDLISELFIIKKGLDGDNGFIITSHPFKPKKGGK